MCAYSFHFKVDLRIAKPRYKSVHIGWNTMGSLDFTNNCPLIQNILTKSGMYVYTHLVHVPSWLLCFLGTSS